MERKTAGVILAIATIAIFIRIFPTFSSFAMGNDFGIYFAIVRDFAISGKIFTTFPSPWGGAGYGDFPVMYWIIIGIWKTTGLGYTELLVKVPPIFGGLASVIVYFIAWEITKNRTISMLSALFDAVNPIIVFQTSISSILVFGHFFGLLTILFFLRYAEDGRYFVAALGSGILLVMSHPLSTFMYLLALLGIILLKLSSDHSLGLRIRYAAFFYPLSAFTFTYWYFFFPNFQNFFASALLGMPAYIVLLSFFLIVTTVFILPFGTFGRYTARIWAFVGANKQFLLRFSLIVYSLSIGVAFLLLTKLLPSFSTIDAVSMIPVVLNGGLAILGLSIVSGRSKTITTGWLLLLGIAFVYSVATWNNVLYPGRFFEYLFEPLSILEGIGVYAMITRLREQATGKYGNFPGNDDTKSFRMIQKKSGHIISQFLNSAKTVIISSGGKRRIPLQSFAIIAILIVLVSTTAATPYQVGTAVTPSGNQSISISDFKATQWLDNNASRNYSVATDHILGLMVDGYNLTGEFDSIHYLWNSSSLNASTVYELMGNSYNASLNYTSVGYVLLDSYMLYNGVWGYEGLTNPYQKPVVMSNSSFLKFLSGPFMPVYFNYTSQTSWALVMEVNWSYLQVNFGVPVPDYGTISHNSTVSPQKILSSISLRK